MDRSCERLLACCHRESFTQLTYILFHRSLKLLNIHDTNDLDQHTYPSWVMTIGLEEEMSQSTLVANVWSRIQQPILCHFENLAAKSTSNLPQCIIMVGPHHDKVRGKPTVKFDLSREDSRRQTEVIVYNKQGEHVSVQTYRDGELIKSQGR
jgi:hypothetical protein